MQRVLLNAWVTKTTAAEISGATRRRQITMTISLNPLRSTIQVRIRGSQFESPLLRHDISNRN